MENKKKTLNQDLKLGLLIEGQTGFDAIEAIIADVGEHLHLLYFGLFDFANSKGIEASWSNIAMFTALEQMVEKASEGGISVGTIARSKDEISILKKAGVEYIVYMNDLGIISEAVVDI